MLHPNVNATHFKTGWPDLKWAIGYINSSILRV